jgi:hypothetical protein
MKVLGGIVLAIGVLAVAMVLGMGCGHQPPAPPCVNVENCNNPADYPPLNDDSPINWAGAKRPDGGTR